MSRFAISLLAFAALGACTSEAEVGKFPLNDEIPAKLDLLLVIDDSGSMQEEQEALIENFDKLLAPLSDIPGGLPSLHLAVVTSSMMIPDVQGCAGDGLGQDGRLHRPECWTADEPYLKNLRVDDGSRLSNVGETVEQAVACLADVGTSGCGFEQPLKAMEQALDGSLEQNDGFLRADAELALVFLGDEDDCSASTNQLFTVDEDTELGPLSSFRCTQQGVACGGQGIPSEEGDYQSCGPKPNSEYVEQVQRYADFLAELKESEKRVLVSVIGGPTNGLQVRLTDGDDYRVEPTCMGAGGGAQPAHRLVSLAERFTFGTSSSVCEDDLSRALTTTGAMISEVFKRPAPVVSTQSGCSTASSPFSVRSLRMTALLAMLTLLALCVPIRGRH